MILIFLFINNIATSMPAHTFFGTGACFRADSPEAELLAMDTCISVFLGVNQIAFQPASTCFYSKWQFLERIVSLQPAST